MRPENAVIAWAGVTEGGEVGDNLLGSDHGAADGEPLCHGRIREELV